MAEVKSNIRSYWLSLFIMCLPYVLGYILCYYSFKELSQVIPNDLLRILAVDIIDTVFVFFFSVAMNNTSMYDPYWSVPTIGFLIYMNYLTQTPESWVNYLILSPAIAYNFKHALYFFRFWPGLKYEDFRYVEFSKKIPNKFIYWVFSFVGLHIFPTIMVYFGIIPTYYTLMSSQSLTSSVYLYLGVFLSWFGLIFETIADEQILPWRKTQSKDIILVGLWRYSRHPNYFGDMLFWIGLFIPCLEFGQDYYFSFFGAAFILLIMNAYTLPAMERHLKKSRPQYNEYQQNVSRMIPWFNSYKPSKKEQ